MGLLEAVNGAEAQQLHYHTAATTLTAQLGFFSYCTSSNEEKKKRRKGLSLTVKCQLVQEDRCRGTLFRATQILITDITDGYRSLMFQSIFVSLLY